MGGGLNANSPSARAIEEKTTFLGISKFFMGWAI